MATDATLAQPEDLIEGGLDVLHRKALTILKRIRDSAVQDVQAALDQVFRLS